MLTRTPRPDLAHDVRSVVPGQHYPCPTLDAVDAHLRYLRISARIAVDLDSLRWCRADMDRLLDRRLMLMRSARDHHRSLSASLV
jgi:hypothetical protein